MERQIIGVSLLDRKTDSWIRQQTQIQDITHKIKVSKHSIRAGHAVRMSDNRWTSRISAWQPRLFKRRQGRPSLRWRDDFVHQYGMLWMNRAADRDHWKSGSGGAPHKVNPHS